MSQSQIKIQSFLANLPLFRELGPQEVERIAAGSRTLHAARGETLFRKGDRVDGFHTIVFGQIKLAFTAPNGAEKVVELLGPNQTFGEAVMFMERPYPVYAQALADSLLLHVSKSVVFEEIERDPKFARKMIGGLSRRLHGLVTDLEAYTLHSGTQRVLGYLLRGMPEGEPESKPVEISLSTSKSILASRLNLTPEHFSRILHDLTEAGLVRVEGRSVRILDPEALRRYDG
ncbi:MAG: Crp/Fnr family transcriptional regulator [Betaproteobacteria bacterium]|nr:Crp/Fnr family transcriptional regulator [Betaproteobacteria bacterium]MDH3435550.1 Crp/Fnr family transcriptional regulator [Betaproteobacteria bacterium]